MGRDAMLPGVTGSLVAPSFLVNVLASECLANADVTRRLRPLLGWWRRVDRALGPAASVRAVADIGALPLVTVLGYETWHLEPHGTGMVGRIGRPGGPGIVLRVGRWDEEPQEAWRDTVRLGRMAGAEWGVVYTGARLRVVDAARTWSRRAIEFDLPRVVSHETSAAALIALLDAAGTRAGADTTLHGIVARSDRHGHDVCESLGSGVLGALTGLVAALDTDRRQRGRRDDREVFQQAVTLVYRLLFLLFAEARAMVPIWHRVYRDAYTIDALCRRFMTQPQRRGLWKAFQAIARLAHAGCRAGDLIVTPFNGRLFAPQHTPLAEQVAVPDVVIGNAVLSLATRTTTAGQTRIAYADLGVEQLGAVYERVLEYEPSRTAGQLRLARTSQERKSSGSFYTPRAMTDFLVRRALHPLIGNRTAEQILALRVLDPSMGSGAFLVGACRHLADAVERAGDGPDLRPGEADASYRARLRRAVAQRCLFGVDINPMAVQLARLSLWLGSLSNDVPLTFLDHHLTVGDSLVGASLADLARTPSPQRSRSDERLPRLPFDAAPQIASVLPDRFRIATEPGDTPAAVREKEHLLASLSAPGTPLDRWKRAADLWCAAWFWPDGLARGVYADVFGSLTGDGSALPRQQRDRVLRAAASLAARHQFFHWELAFPEVFFTADGRRDPDGGFDAVIGNPPWDVLRADTGKAESRAQARAANAAQLRFFRDSGIYRFQSRGHFNRYQLFLERALQLVRPGGRIALILPSGLASDHGSAALRRAVLDSLELDRVLGFDNREVIFPIHRDVRFLLVTGTRGGPTERLAGVFGRSHAGWLDQLPDSSRDDPPEARPITLSRALLESLDPEHVTIPWLARQEDLHLLATITLSTPALADPRAWHVRFGRELNATDDRPHFIARPAVDRPGLLPVIEGKHLEPFRVLRDASALRIPARTAATLVDASKTFECGRLAYRDVASATNRITLIAAALPPGTISTHTVFCSKSPLGEDARYCLLAFLNSLVANYLVRLHVTTHVTCALMARLPVPRPPSSSSAFKALASLARSLERTGLAGHDATYARLNAIVAHLYGLTRAHYDYILSTFPLLSSDLLSLASAAFTTVTSRETDTQEAT